MINGQFLAYPPRFPTSPDVPAGTSQGVASVGCRFYLTLLVGTQLSAYRDAMPNIHLGSIALDCADPLPLATFWADLLGGEVAFTSDAFVAVKTDQIWLAATRVEDYLPPSWPESRMPKQMHLDLAVDDLKEAEQRATALGAVRAKSQPAPERYVVLIDPAGHPFCLSVQIPE
jgi:Glyoxalase-like domain